MFWDVLDKPRQSLLKRLCKNPPLEGAYLAGGTALAWPFDPGCLTSQKKLMDILPG